ncbi:DUF1501 domain-containing protein [Polaromonas sp. SM01]|uniref:DUF1501 domain-containing protein n=1 Tax=Polaromonas sp. SM01 TaxID=3085630 RepID=UPI002982076C|nr:DUF1501 domain-containing protein [Polaromonas sp. SM01]MDW5444732.1 DUF1501 domain-containing protein [Polaromonas sp. SM01]
MKRRNLLQSVAALSLAAGAGQLLAAPAAQSRLLVVFLRGAYDACNLLVPISSNFYYEARPDIAVLRPGADLNSALPLTADWGLHPALRDTVYPLFQKGELAFIPFAGTDDSSRSHFETQDSIELGQALDRSRDYRSGFMNRLAAVVNGAAPIAFTNQLPLVLQGQVQVPNAALKAVAKSSVDTRQSQLIASMYQGTALASRVDEGFSVRDEVMREMSAEMDAASRNAMTAKGFGGEARRIARLMRDRYNLGFVDVGGWDTHVNQGGAQGYLANRLDELGQGLAAFAQEMGPAWRDTTVVVVSEFGRTFRQNGNRGTDHGHGTVYWVLGGSVRGQRMAGEQVRVEPASLFQNRDYPVLNEYRAVLAGLFARQFGLNTGQLDQVFAGVKARDLGLL